MSKPIFNVLRLTLSLTITAKRSGNSKANYNKYVTHLERVKLVIFNVK